MPTTCSMELNLRDADVLLHALEQAFQRAYEIAINREFNPPVLFVERMLKTMQEIHNLAVRYGEKIKTLDYVDTNMVDDFTSMCGRFDSCVDKVKSRIEELSK